MSWDGKADEYFSRPMGRWKQDARRSHHCGQEEAEQQQSVQNHGHLIGIRYILLFIKVMETPTAIYRMVQKKTFSNEYILPTIKARCFLNFIRWLFLQMCSKCNYDTTKIVNSSANLENDKTNCLHEEVQK